MSKFYQAAKFIPRGSPYDVQKLVPKLKIAVRNTPLKFRQPEGPFGRLKLLRKTVTALIKYERLELNFPRASEARGYTERLITEAIRYGECHRPTMELVDFWLEEKQLIHKLFKVLVPRYKEMDTAFTKIHSLPAVTNSTPYKRAILELIGNPYPAVIQETIPRKYHLQNILLHEAKKEFHGDNLPTYHEKTRFMQQHPQPEDEVTDNTVNEEKELIEKFVKLETESKQPKDV